MFGTTQQTFFENHCELFRNAKLSYNEFEVEFSNDYTHFMSKGEKDES